MKGKPYKSGKAALAETIEMLAARNKSFFIEKKRENISIYTGKIPIFIIERDKTKSSFKHLNKRQKAQVISLFGNVKKSAERYIVRNKLDIREIKSEYSSNYRNWDFIKSLPVGTEFFYIDLKHCYWRFAYLMGILSKTIYEGKDAPEMKVFRNMSLSCIIAPKSRIQYVNGRKVSEISEDTRIFNTLYTNIRHQAWNFTGSTSRKVHKDCLGYKVDGIMVLKKSVKKVIKIIEQNDLLYTITRCEKMSDTHYVFDDEIKKF